MYDSYFEFRTKPFTLLPDPSFLYLGEGHSTALSMLEYGLMNNAGFTVITGDIGCGKTTLIRHLLNQMDDESTVGLITNTGRLENLMRWVLWSFDVNVEGADSPSELYQRFVDFLISEYASRRKCILIVDEAQNMTDSVLEELRLLSNINADSDLLLQMILVGQPSLRRTLSSPRLLQFAQRITVHHHLVPLDRAETKAYIGHRLKLAGGDAMLFDSKACDAVYKYSVGVPRLINQICDTALVYAFADKLRSVTDLLVDAVVSDRRAGGLPLKAGGNGINVDDMIVELRSPQDNAPIEAIARTPRDEPEDFRELFSELRGK